MAIITDRTIFYHVPKTGGTWVTEAMRNAGIPCRMAPITGRHLFGPMIYRTHAAPGNVQDAGDRFGFCFVRHPVDWYRSYWQSIQGAKLSGRWWMDRLPRDDLNEWVNALLDKSPSFVTELYNQYLTGVGYIGRREHLADGLVSALHQAGEAFDEDALRATRPLNVGNLAGCDLLEPGTLDRIVCEEQWVIERWY